MNTRIKKIRKQHGYTQTDLATKLGVSVSTVAMWETGKRQPQYKNVTAMSKLFEVDEEYILGGSDIMRKHPKMNAQQWVIDDECRKILTDYLVLDMYGKTAVQNLIQVEKLRCLNQRTAIMNMEEE